MAWYSYTIPIPTFPLKGKESNFLPFKGDEMRMRTASGSSRTEERPEGPARLRWGWC